MSVSVSCVVCLLLYAMRGTNDIPTFCIEFIHIDTINDLAH